MMRMPLYPRTLAMLCVALAAGLCAAWAARQHIQGRIRQIEDQARVQTVPRIVAARDLAAGTRLDAEQIAVRHFPAGLAASDSIAPEHHGQLVGRILLAPLRAGDAILPVHAAALAGPEPFSERLGEGRRAITMPVDAINSASGLLQPGDLIDLYVSFDHQRKRITAPLLQGVLVLATGTSTQAGEEPGLQAGYATVTLDTSPEDAIKLVAARQGGALTAVLRRPDDSRSTQKAARGDLASLLGVPGSQPAAPAPRPAPVIYGDRPVAALAGMTPAKTPQQSNGLFDLPYMPELVSAWMAASERAASAGPEAQAGAGPTGIFKAAP